jgi:hypothetical protein
MEGGLPHAVEIAFFRTPCHRAVQPAGMLVARRTRFSTYSVFLQKRRAIWRLAGDLRGEGASILLNLWQSLGWTEGDDDDAIHYGVRSYSAFIVNALTTMTIGVPTSFASSSWPSRQPLPQPPRPTEKQRSQYSLHYGCSPILPRRSF